MLTPEEFQREYPLLSQAKERIKAIHGLTEEEFWDIFGLRNTSPTITELLANACNESADY